MGVKGLALGYVLCTLLRERLEAVVLLQTYNLLGQTVGWLDIGTGSRRNNHLLRIRILNRIDR